MSMKIIKLLIIIGMIGLTSARVVYPEGLWPMNAFGQFTSENQQILAYYDFNRDRFVDVLTCVHGAGYQIKVYIWNQEMRTFVNRASLNLSMFKPDVAIAADVVQDGTIDLILTMALAGQDIDHKFQTVIYCVDCTNTTCKIQNTANVQPFGSDNYPTVMQIQAENIIVYSQDGNLQSRVFRRGKFYEQQFVKEYFIQSTDDIVSSVCVDYNNIFYLDYNGDCFQDLIIHCNSESGMADLQFYRGNQKSQFKPQYKAKIMDGLKLLNVAIVDINFDGLVDVIELVRTLTGELYFEIHYNTAVKQALSICKITISSQTAQYFPFHFISSDNELSQAGVLQIQRVSLPYNFQQWTIQKMITSNFYIRSGDINNDGYMDLIIDGPNKAELLINQQCLSESCGTYNSKFMQKWPLGKIRIFSRRAIDGMTNYDGKICEMSFFDIHEDGRLDLFSNLCPLASFDQQKAGKILAIYNSLPIDAFFIKITVLENLENQVIKSQTMDLKLNTFGAHADFFVTALNGQSVPACGNQLSHPGRSLELPYIHTGLGRTNNYVQEVSITVSGKDSVILKTWSPIVPNSQLIIVPGPKWVLQTYISPTSVMAVLFWFVVLILALLAFWIARLTRRQKLQDKQNQDSFYSILR